jgi:transposase InsO family protein
VIDRLASTRGLPKLIRSDNGRGFCDKAMVAWAHERAVQLRLIKPGKPNRTAYVVSINGRLRDACLNEHLVSQLATRARKSKTGGANTMRSDRTSLT